jgi:hypothetical protein
MNKKSSFEHLPDASTKANRQRRDYPHEDNPKLNLRFFIICCVLCLTILSALGASAIMLFGQSPLNPTAERLFEEFLFFAGAGFFALLGTLGHGHL